MRSEKVDRFLKTKDCPPSEDLLSLTLAAFPIESTSEIISHLDVCDFCAAEAHFLSRFQATEPLWSITATPRIFGCWQNRCYENDLQRSNYSVRNFREGIAKSRLSYLERGTFAESLLTFF